LNIKYKMKKSVLKVGIAGYGIVGKRRRDFIDKHPALKTVAVCDKFFTSKGQFDDGVKYFPHYEDLLKEDLDILFVCLTNDVAAEVTIKGLKQGLHVFCEKPPGRDVADIERVIAVEKENPNLRLKYGFNHRYHGSVRDAQNLISSGKIGEIINIRGVYGKSKIISFSSDWRTKRAIAGGGILLDQGIHMLDLIRLFCSDFVEVKSFVSNSFWNHDVEDNAYALMKDSQGRVAMLHSTATQWQHRFSLEISCTKGFIELRGILSGSKSYGQEVLSYGFREETTDTGSTSENRITYLDDPSWKDEISDFAAAIVDGKPITDGTAADALEVMKLVYRVYGADPQWAETYDLKKL
jgi:predicted dehydrogenase